MAVMPIYGKNPSKIFFSETNRLISRKLGVKHQWLKYSNVFINHDPVMTLTKFMARSTWVAYAFEWGKLLKCHLKGKASRKLADGQNIDYSEKRKWPKGVICPCTGVKLFKHVYWYMQHSEIDNDAYCVYTHDFSPCTHRNIRPVRTMYAVKISGTQTVYDLMRTQIKYL